MSEFSDRFSNIASYYDKLVKQYGHDPRSCDYGRAESQRIKFEVLTDGIKINNNRILDVGCGMADYNVFLNERFDNFQYTGIDISDEMIKTARELHPGLDIRKLDIMKESPGEYDYIVANGIFYLLGDNAITLMKTLVSRMFDLSQKGLAFNSLSSFAVDQEANEFYADPGEIINYCLTLTDRVVIRHDYHKRDFTVFMYR